METIRDAGAQATDSGANDVDGRIHHVGWAREGGWMGAIHHRDARVNPRDGWTNEAGWLTNGTACAAQCSRMG